jgi:hypothetical protein
MARALVPAKPSAFNVSTAAATSCLLVPAERDESASLAATLLDVPDLAISASLG